MLEQDRVVCSLMEVRDPGEKHNSYKLTSDRGNWLIRTTKKWSRFSVHRDGEEAVIGEIRNNLGEEPDFFCDLYIDLCTHKAISAGYRWQVELKKEVVFQYGRPWKDSDIQLRICYQLYLTGKLDERHRDILLVAPLFWTGMGMYSSTSTS